MVAAGGGDIKRPLKFPRNAVEQMGETAGPEEVCNNFFYHLAQRITGAALLLLT